MNKYEGIFIIKNMEDSSKMETVINQIEDIVQKEGGKIFHNEKMGLKRLAYEIKGSKEGYYYYIKFKEDKDEDIQGKISMKINTVDEVMKHIIIKNEGNEENE